MRCSVRLSISRTWFWFNSSDFEPYFLDSKIDQQRRFSSNLLACVSIYPFIVYFGILPFRAHFFLDRSTIYGTASVPKQQLPHQSGQWEALRLWQNLQD